MKIRSSLFALSTFLTVGLAIGTATESKQKPPCRVEIHGAHLSTSISERQGRLAIKVNGFSICNKPHSDVTLTVQLWEEGTFTRRLVAQSTVRNPGTLPPSSKLRNLSTFELCKNRESHFYFGRAFGKALVNGVWHYARDDFEGKLFPIPCGT